MRAIILHAPKQQNETEITTGDSKGLQAPDYVTGGIETAKYAR